MAILLTPGFTFPIKSQKLVANPSLQQDSAREYLFELLLTSDLKILPAPLWRAFLFSLIRNPSIPPARHLAISPSAIPPCLCTQWQ
jgi:hypothetical protein